MTSHPLYHLRSWRPVGDKRLPSSSKFSRSALPPRSFVNAPNACWVFIPETASWFFFRKSANPSFASNWSGVMVRSPCSVLSQRGLAKTMPVQNR